MREFNINPPSPLSPQHESYTESNFFYYVWSVSYLIMLFVNAAQTLDESKNHFNLLSEFDVFNSNILKLVQYFL